MQTAATKAVLSTTSLRKTESVGRSLEDEMFHDLQLFSDLRSVYLQRLWVWHWVILHTGVRNVMFTMQTCHKNKKCAKSYSSPLGDRISYCLFFLGFGRNKVALKKGDMLSFIKTHFQRIIIVIIKITKKRDTIFCPYHTPLQSSAYKWLTSSKHKQNHDCVRCL